MRSAKCAEDYRVAGLSLDAAGRLLKRWRPSSKAQRLAHERVKRNLGLLTQFCNVKYRRRYHSEAMSWLGEHAAYPFSAREKVTLSEE
jgi:hypothetical protein